MRRGIGLGVALNVALSIALPVDGATAQVTAHRGASATLPENTLPAFRAALESGAEWIDCEVRNTADGRLVVFHDATTGRMAERNLVVADATLAELLGVDVAHRHRERRGLDRRACPPAHVPTLAEVLELVRADGRAKLSIQPMDDGTAAICELVAELGATASVGFHGGDVAGLTLAKQRLPTARIRWDRPADHDLERDLEIAAERGFEVLGVHEAYLDRPRIARIRAAGLAVGARVVDDPGRIAELFALGVDRIATPDPATAVGIRQRQARLAAEVEALRERHGLPSLAVGLVAGPRLWFTAVCGRAGADRPADLDTRYRIASISKVFTATLLAALAADGTVALDDRLVDRLPPRSADNEEADEDRVAPEPWAAPIAAITLEQLAAHSSGLPRMPESRLPGSFFDPYGAPGSDYLVAALTETELADRPPAPFAYSNFGSALLGLALATAAGRPYAELLTERVLDPIGMSATAVFDPEPEDPRLATGHYRVEPPTPAVPWTLGAFAPAGGVVTTVPDLARFVAAHLTAGDDATPGDDGLPRAALAAMQSQRVADAEPGRGAGLGWLRSRLADGTELVWHNGALGGFTSLLVMEPTNGVAIFALSNVGPGPGPGPLEDVVAAVRKTWRETIAAGR